MATKKRPPPAVTRGTGARKVDTRTALQSNSRSIPLKKGTVFYLHVDLDDHELRFIERPDRTETPTIEITIAKHNGVLVETTRVEHLKRFVPYNTTGFILVKPIPHGHRWKFLEADDNGVTWWRRLGGRGWSS